jgi:phospholipid/cholesterol/gamma-HCH transport system permease protein
MMSAKVGTGLVAEIGAMRISDEIDALEVMGKTRSSSSVRRACWRPGSCCRSCTWERSERASSPRTWPLSSRSGRSPRGGFFLIFWMFQNPPDLVYSLIKAMAMATVVVLVGCYYGYNAAGGLVGVGTATAKSMVLNTVMVHLVGMVGTQIFWGSNPRAPIGG